MMNRLKTAMSEHVFEIKNRQKSGLPNFLKMAQEESTLASIDNTRMFNHTIHVNTIDIGMMTKKVLIAIMDESWACSVAAIIIGSDTTSMVKALQKHWFDHYGYPRTIFLKQGKVQTSRLEASINNCASLTQKVTCKSRSDTFNKEVEQQWLQYQPESSEEEFIHTNNFLHGLQKPKTNDHLNSHNWGFNEITENTPETDNNSDIKDKPNIDFVQSNHQARRKSISLCRHKLQGRTICRSRRGRQQARQHLQNRLPESEEDRQLEADLVNEQTDRE
jgi:hypothetical protein